MHLNFNSAGVSEDLFIRTGGDTDSATEIARFTNTGRLGLGGIDPSHQLHIKSAATNQDIVVISSAGTSATKIIQITKNQHIFSFFYKSFLMLLGHFAFFIYKTHYLDY